MKRGEYEQEEDYFFELPNLYVIARFIFQSEGRQSVSDLQLISTFSTCCLFRGLISLDIGCLARIGGFLGGLGLL